MGDSTDIETVDNSRVQRYVLRHIGKKSAREMAEELGVKPDDILRAKQEIVDSVDEITIQVQKAKLLTTLQELADDAQDRSLRASDEFFAGTVNASVGAIKALLVELNRTSKNEQEAINALNMLRVRELTSLLVEVVETSVPEISERYEIDSDELYEIFNRRLEESARKRDAR